MKRHLIIILMVIFATCKGQNSKSTNDFFFFIKGPDDVSITNYSIKKEDDVTVIYYEFYMKDVHIGEGCIFAIPKQYPSNWVNEAINYPRNNCTKKTDYKRYYVACEAKNLFTKDREELIRNFDIYTFFVDKNNLEGPFLETSEFGSAEYYNEKPDSKIIIYKYELGNWIEIEKQKLGNRIPRTFGEKYIEKLIKERIK